MAEWRELGAIDFPYDTKKYYQLKVVNEGPRIQAYIDDRKVLEASDNEIIKGKVGLTANIPARFQDFRVQVSERDKRQIEQRIQLREKELAKLRADNPKPKLWKKFNTPKFGAGRNVRFGDLDGDGRLDMLIAQNIPRVCAAMPLTTSVASPR